MLTHRIEALVAQAKEDARRAMLRCSPDVSSEVGELMVEIAERAFDPQFSLERAGGDDDRPTWRARRRFKNELGLGPKQFLDRMKSEAASRLLLETDLEIQIIAEALHFSRGNNFSRMFKRWTGSTPTAYRAEARQTVDLRELAGSWWQAFSGKLSGKRQDHFEEHLEALYSPAGGGDSSAVPPLLEIRGSTGDNGPAEVVWQLLDGEPQDVRLELLRHRIRCDSPIIFEDLSRRALEMGRQDRRCGVELAELALATVEGNACLLAERHGNLQALAWARLGNCLSLAENHTEADQAFRESERLWSLQDNRRENRTRAEISFLVGSHRLFQRRYDEAFDLLSESMILAKNSGATEILVKAELQLVAVMVHQGRLEATISHLRRILRLDGENFETQLHARQNLAAILIRLAQYSEARAEIALAEGICEKLGRPVSKLQLRWLRAQINSSEGKIESAEADYRLIRQGFQNLKELNYLAEVSLELAILLSDQQRHDEVIELLMTDVNPVFESLDIHREALAALSMLQGAVAAGQASRKTLKKAKSFLEMLPALQTLDHRQDRS